MDRPIDYQLQETFDRRTVLAPAAQREPRANICCPKREAAGGSAPHLTQETQMLLRGRLRAASAILLVGFGAFLIRHIGGLLAGEPFDPLLLAAHLLVVSVLGFSLLPLCQKCPVSIRKLRTAELIVFGLPALFFLLLQHRTTLTEAARSHLPTPMPFWLLLIFTYAMFIPNTWRRAAWVIGAMALAPDLLLVAMAAIYPEVATVMTGVMLLQYVLTMSIAAIAAVVGTHLINALRREAFEAKQLGQYRLITLLGRGGMGEVHLAEHRMLKRACAIKLIRPEHTGDPQTLARFEREVQMTARLSHWNTIEVYDYGRTDDGTFFYVMEYLPGLSLEDLLQRYGPMPAERVIHVLRQTSQALREAHGIGLIHRDIKPGNIFLAQRGGLHDVAKLLDFGLVKPLTEIASARLTQEGAISGTPLYMSPEQARGQNDVDARSDIYSLGAVGYALLTGRPPFEGNTPIDAIIAHARDEVAAPSVHQADIPVDVERIILRCLAKNPDDRFPDAESLDQALAECDTADSWSQAQAADWWRERDVDATPTLELNVAAA